MTDVPLCFGPFTLDRAGRQLSRGGVVVDLNARYFDALCLLATEPGQLISKDRFLGEVWHGIPVTDEALTQCIRTLRRVLGDDATCPTYIATVPKHGYRFIAATDSAVQLRSPVRAPTRLWTMWLGTTLGGLIAGGIGGLTYGLIAVAHAPAMGGISVLLVLFALTAAISALGASGVGLGLALAHRRLPGHGPALMVGGAAGGVVIGAVTKLIGTDAFMLVLGAAPASMSGAGEGALLGGATGLALWLARWPRLADARALRLVVAAGCGGVAGAGITALGGRLFAGSLASLEQTFAASRLNLAAIGGWVGEPGFGPATIVATAVLEGALFTAAIVWAVRRLGR